MSKSKNPVRSPLRLSSYADLIKYVDAFAEGHLNLLILIGAPGLGKSQILKKALSDDVCWIDGHTTAFGMYCRLYEQRDRHVVIDDVDDLHHNPDAVRLLKSLCQSDREKSIAWNSTTRQLDQRGIPHQFGSRTAIVANDWRCLNLDVEALEDRGHVVQFIPTPLEVHLQAAEWFDDQEVFDFIGSRLSFLEQPSFRHYVSTAELKRAGLDWRRAMLSRCLSGKKLIVAQLKADVRFVTEEERAQAFVAAGHGCRATYFNIARKLPAATEPPPLPLKSMQDEVPPPLDILEFLKEQHGHLGMG